MSPFRAGRARHFAIALTFGVAAAAGAQEPVTATRTVVATRQACVPIDSAATVATYRAPVATTPVDTTIANANTADRNVRSNTAAGTITCPPGTTPALIETRAVTTSMMRIPIDKGATWTESGGEVISNVNVPGTNTTIIDTTWVAGTHTSPAPIEPAPMPSPVRRSIFGTGMTIGLAAGAALPVQEIREAYNPGWNISVPLGFDLPLSPFGFRVNLGFNQFDARSTFRSTGTTDPETGSVAVLADDDPQIWSAIADLKLRAPLGMALGRLIPGLYAVGGAGVNYFRNFGSTFALTNPGIDSDDDTVIIATSSDADFGRFAWNAGGGISFGFGGTEMFIESRYVSVMTRNESLNYVPVVLGIALR